MTRYIYMLSTAKTALAPKIYIHTGQHKHNDVLSSQENDCYNRRWCGMVCVCFAGGVHYLCIDQFDRVSTCRTATLLVWVWVCACVY